MKKLFLSLFVAGTLTFALQSCGTEDPCDGVTCGANETCVDGDCVPNSTACDVCGTFNGTTDGTIAITLTGTDTTFTDIPLSAVVSELATAGSYNLAVDISPLLGAPAGTLVPDVDGTLSGSTITITNQVYTYSGIANITINGTVVYDAAFNNITGSLDLTDDAVGSITFDGVRQ
jgi:hypothetical protein